MNREHRFYDFLTSLIMYTCILLFSLICLLPFWIIVLGSFTSEVTLNRKGYQLFTSHFSLDAYRYILSSEQIYRSYGITIFVTLVGTTLAVLVTMMFAYVLSHRKVKYRHVLSFLTYFTLLFGAGLVGFYILIANWLGLKDSIWALILPYLMNPFYAFIFVSYFRTIPFELNEAATVDGANEFTIFFRMMIPISSPIIATVTLFYSIQYWNDWWLGLLFIDNYKLHPLQLMIRQLISNLDIQSYIKGSQTSYTQMVPSMGVQLATVCLTIGPIILVYPFLQKYFIKGITIGSLKG